jgi:hypothetical protein
MSLSIGSFGASNPREGVAFGINGAIQLRWKKQKDRCATTSALYVKSSLDSVNACVAGLEAMYMTSQKRQPWRSDFIRL